jgi:hypothetical protein
MKRVKRGFEDELRQYEDELVEDEVKFLEKVFKNPKLAREAIMGEFTPKEFEWIKNETKRMMQPSIEAYEKSFEEAGRDRQYKLRAKRRIMKAGITLFHASYLSLAFNQVEWDEMLPVPVLGQIVYFTALRGGYLDAAILIDAFNKGINDNLESTSAGFFKGQVSFAITPSIEKMSEFGTRIGERAVKLMKEKLAVGEQ